MLIKYAAARVLSSSDQLGSLLAPHFDSRRVAAIGRRVAANDPSLLDPNRFTYLRVRAVSAGEGWGPNDNGDWFGDAELNARHATFVYDPHYVDHDNTNSLNAIGIVIASVYHPLKQGNKTAKRGGWVEIIAAIDRERASKIRVAHIAGNPDLLTAIKTGQVTDTSMGCFVEYSLCSICNNRASDITEYCPHIANSKGQMVMCPDGQRRLAFEDNRGVVFFENSVITTRLEHGGGGADLNAKILSEVAENQRTAAAGQSIWTDLIVNRLDLIKARETAMKDKAKAAGVRTAQDVEVNGPDATRYQTKLAPEDKVGMVDTGDYYDVPENKDQSLFDQSQGTSEPSATPVIIDKPEEKLSQQTGEVDYPLPDSAGSVPEPPASPDNIAATGKKEAEADPMNTIGGTPEEVLEKEQEIEEEKAEAVAPLQDAEKAEDAEGEMEDRHDRERDKTDMAENKSPVTIGDRTWGRRIRSFVGNLLQFKTADVSDGEGSRILQDYVKTAKRTQAKLIAEMEEAVSTTKKRANIRRVNAIQKSVNRAIQKIGFAAVSPRYAAFLDKKAEQYGGNPQQLVDFEDVYEQGDPDHNLYEQSQPASPTEPPIGVGEGSNVAEEESADDHPVPQYGEVLSALKSGKWARGEKGRLTFTAGRIKLAGSDASDMLDKIEMHMGAGLPYEAAETKVLEDMASRITASKETASGEGSAATKLTGSRASLMERLQATADSDEEEENGEDDMDSKEASRKTARPGSDYTGEDPRGGGKTDPEAKLESGNAETLGSPSTRDVVGDGGEMLRSSDPTAKRPVQPVEGTRHTAEDVEDRLDDGNKSTLESPSTGEVADDANEYEAGKAGMDQQGNSVPAPETTLSTRDALLQRMAQENRNLRKSVMRSQADERKRRAASVVRMMVAKGMFQEHGNQLRQQDAAQKEYNRLCKLPTIAFAEAERQVKAARQGTRLPREWTREVPVEPRDGSVRVAVNQPQRQSDPDGERLGVMFEEKPY